MKCLLCGDAMHDSAMYGVCFTDIQRLIYNAIKDKRRAVSAEPPALGVQVESTTVAEESRNE